MPEQTAKRSWKDSTTNSIKYLDNIQQKIVDYSIRPRKCKESRERKIQNRFCSTNKKLSKLTEERTQFNSGTNTAEIEAIWKIIWYEEREHQVKVAYIIYKSQKQQNIREIRAPEIIVAVGKIVN